MNEANLGRSGWGRGSFRLPLAVGLCPALAVTTTAEGALWLGLLTAGVLFISEAIAAVVRRLVPPQARFYCQAVSIAALATILDLILGVAAPSLDQGLGIFVPLIAVNCLVLTSLVEGRGLAELSALTGWALGFLGVLVAVGSVREVLGAGTWFGQAVLGKGFLPWGIISTPGGAFLTLGLLLGAANALHRPAKADQAHVPAHAGVRR